MKKIYVEMVADLFHYGHVEFLRKARALGDYLVVGVLSDEWSKQHKKEPILTQAERARIVEACRYVDEVLLQEVPVSATWLHENGFAHNVVAFGTETDKTRHLNTSYGYDRSREIVLPYEHGISTTDILNRVEDRIRARDNELATIKEAFGPRWQPSEWLLVEQMLRDIQRIFKAHGISWFLAFGSLLGAARHLGAIPWDDDIDIAIFDRDEERLKKLVGELHHAGYGLIEFNQPHPKGLETFYKMWIRNRPSTFLRPYSWPFVDIFIMRESEDPSIWKIDYEEFSASHFLPLAEKPFGSLTVPVPARTDDLLKERYGPDYMTVCSSTNYIHRHERNVTQIMRPASDVEEAGCFTPIHHNAEKMWKCLPERIERWNLVESGSGAQLVRDHNIIELSEPAVILWKAMDKPLSFEELVAQIDGPRIDAIETVQEVLGKFQKFRAVKIQGNPFR